MGKKSEKGNAIELVIIGVLVLGIAGLLVWRFVGSNSTSQVSQSSAGSSSSSSTTSNNDATLTDVSIDNGKVMMKVPKSWSVVKTAQPTYRSYAPEGDHANETTEKLVVTAPSGDVYLELENGVGGIGGGCDPDVTPVLTQTTIRTLKNDSDNKLVQWRSVTGSTYETTVVSTSDAAKVKDGVNGCDVAWIGLLHGYYIDTTRLWIGSTVFDANREKGIVITSDAFNKYVNSSEYQEAVAIIESISK